MCGIVGMIDITGRPLPVRDIPRRCLSLLAHRGPDGQGELLQGPVWFGHTRLAVIDPTPEADQPMVDPSGALAITFNGEIVNFPDLRSRLSGRGHRFRTRSDTEVLLAAYREWGTGCLDRLAGMFAFAIYDMRTGEVVVVRDRAGVKPVYYTQIDDRLVFCSEIKPLLALPGFVPEPDLPAVSAFLSFRQPLADRTCFRGVRALPPGHCLTIARGRAEIHRWWSLRNPDPVAKAQQATRGHHPAAQGLADLIGDVVRETAISDVPTAVLLSGGLDSSIVAYELARERDDLLTVTARFQSAADDESGYAREVARALGARQLVVNCMPQDYLAEAVEMTGGKAQPIGLHNEPALRMLARAIKPHASVVLSGEGADELFLGYGRIFRLPFDQARLRAARSLPDPISRRWLRSAGLAGIPSSWSGFDLFLDRYCYWPLPDKLDLFTPAMREAVDDDRRVRAILEPIFDRPTGLTDSLADFFATVHLRGLLDSLDVAFMASGVELRVPFTDHRVIAAAVGIPYQHRLRWRGPAARVRATFEPVHRISERRDRTKACLRRAYSDRLPSDVLSRPKLPFPVPLSSWLLADQRNRVERLLLGDDAVVGELVDRVRLRRWLDCLGPDAPDRIGRQVWLLVGLEIWLRNFFPDGINW